MRNLLTTSQVRFVRKLLVRCESRNPDLVSFIEGSPGCFGDGDENLVIDEMVRMLKKTGNPHAGHVVSVLGRFKC